LRIFYAARGKWFWSPLTAALPPFCSLCVAVPVGQAITDQISGSFLAPFLHEVAHPQSLDASFKERLTSTLSYKPSAYFRPFCHSLSLPSSDSFLPSFTYLVVYRLSSCLASLNSDIRGSFWSVLWNPFPAGPIDDFVTCLPYSLVEKAVDRTVRAPPRFLLAFLPHIVLPRWRSPLLCFPYPLDSCEIACIGQFLNTPVQEPFPNPNPVFLLGLLRSEPS